MSEPKNKTRRNTECRTDDFFPEVCYPKNDAYWNRITACDEQGNPCELDLSGLRRPDATPTLETGEDPGVTVGNSEVVVGCPGSYSGSSTATVPANQFVRFIANSRNKSAIEEAQQIVNNLATTFAQTQLNCFAYNTSQSVSCPATHDGETLVTSPNTSVTVLAGENKTRLRSVRTALNQAARLAIQEDTISVGDFVAQLDLAPPNNFFEVTGFTNGLADYAAPVDSSTAYASMYAADLATANAVALTDAYTQLDCEYGNPQVIVNCPNDTNGDAPSNTQGEPSVTIERDSITYRLINLEAGAGNASLYNTVPDQSGLPSLEDQAKTLAVSSLRCVWTNKKVSLQCPSVASGPIDCDAADACSEKNIPRGEGLVDRGPQTPFSQSRTRLSVNLDPIEPSASVVQAGQFQNVLTFNPETADPDALVFSGQTKDQLNDQAKSLALTLLQCRYGNDAFRGAAVCCPDLSTIPSISNQSLNLGECKVASVTNLDGVSTPPVVNTQTITKNLIKSSIAPLAAPPGGWLPFDVDSTALTIDAGEIVQLTNGLALGDIASETENSFTIQGTIDPTKPQIAKDLADSIASSTICDPFAVCLWGNEAISPTHCEPELAEDPTLAQPYRKSEPSETIAQNSIVSTDGKYAVQEIALTIALSSRVCQTELVGNVGFILECADPTGDGISYPTASVTPEVNPDSYYGLTECEATELAVDIAFATKLCAYSNTLVSSSPCPAGTVARGGDITLEEGTIIDYSPSSNPTSIAQTIADASRVCVEDSSVGGVFDDGSCALLLTGEYTVEDGVPVPSSITYSVTAGSIRKKNGDPTKEAVFGGASFQTYIHNRKHFYLEFDVDSNDEPEDGTVVNVVQSSVLKARDYTVETEGKAYLYIGSFKGYATSGGVFDPTSTSIETENTLCAENPYYYSTGGDPGPEGIYLYGIDSANDIFIPKSTILENYNDEDNWSVVLNISSLEWDGTIAYDSGTSLYDVAGTGQTVARIPIYRGGNFVTTYGVFHEGLRSESGNLVVSFE